MERLGEGVPQSKSRVPDVKELIESAFEASIILETLANAVEKVERAKTPEDKVTAGQEYLQLLSAAVDGDHAQVMTMLNAGVAAVRELIDIKAGYGNGKA